MSASAMRFWSRSLFLKRCAVVLNVLICSGACPIALIATPGLAVRRCRLLFCIGSRDAASTADNLREVSVQAVSKSAVIVLGGVAVQVLGCGELYIVEVAG